MVKDIIISTLLTYIIWTRVFVVHTHPLFLIPMLWILITLVILEVEDQIKERWSY